MTPRTLLRPLRRLWRGVDGTPRLRGLWRREDGTHRIRSLWRREDGSGTVEFALIFPLFFGLFMACFELGMLMTRQVMLDRGVDGAVRLVRLGAFGDLDGAPLHDAVKEQVCAMASLIPDCDSEMRLEMRRVDPRDWGMMNAEADCVDRADRGAAIREFTAGTSNELMVMRACALFDPLLPTWMIDFNVGGLNLGEGGGQANEYALLASTAFVIEPRGGN